MARARRKPSFFTHRLTPGARDRLGRTGSPRANHPLRRRRFPHPEEAGERMTEHFVAEEELVFPLHLGHGQQAVDHLVVPARGGVHRGVLVLDDVVPLEVSGAVDGEEPAADVAEAGNELADAPEDDFAHPPRPRAELLEQSADQAPVMPFLRFDLPDALALLWFAQAVPVPAI